MDGKHIRIVAPRKSGAKFYNYKGYYSIVLMALVGPNYEFLFVDVGKNGRLADGGVIEETSFYMKLKDGSLNLPSNDKTKYHLNFVFLGDEAFALHKNFLKPYPNCDIDHQKRVFNYRVSRGRNVAEDAFGIITNRFGVLQKPISMKHENVCYVILAICSLHNYLRRHSPTYLNIESNTTSTITTRNTRQVPFQMEGFEAVPEHNNSDEATTNRDQYKFFF